MCAIYAINLVFLNFLWLSQVRLQMDNLILKGLPLSVPTIDKGIGEYFYEQADVHGNKVFQIDGDSGYTETYLVAKNRSTRVAIGLQKLGIKQKDVVMICCGNNSNNVIPALASWYIGSYVACIDPRQAVADIKHALKLVTPKVIFVEEKSVPSVERSLEDSNIISEIIVIGNSDKYPKMFDMEKETDEEKNFKPIKQTGSDIIGILFSSGTTSVPKGIQISNTYTLGGAQALLEVDHIKPGVIMHFSSLHWSSAWLWLGTSIITGTAKLTTSNISGEKFLQLVDKHKVTYVFSTCSFTYEITNLSPEVIKKYDTTSLYSFGLGGSTMDPQQMLRIRKLLPNTYITLGYGSTEGNCMVVNFPDRKAYEEKISSSGKLISNAQLKVVDLETGKPLGPNQEGEICIKSPFLMSGYYQFEKSDIFDDSGFFKTGDVGYYDEDQYIYVTDRIGAMFKYRRNHISPSLIELVLLTHPSVAEAVVFGVPHPIDRNHPGACVVLKNEANATVQELLELVNSKVSDYQKLRAGLVMVKSIPKTPTGKIQRRAVRDLFIKTINK